VSESEKPEPLSSKEDRDRAFERAQELLEHPERLSGYAGPALMQHTLLLEMTFKSLLLRSAGPEERSTGPKGMKADER
jgi:hypothetical protein